MQAQINELETEVKHNRSDEIQAFAQILGYRSIDASRMERKIKKIEKELDNLDYKFDEKNNRSRRVKFRDQVTVFH